MSASITRPFRKDIEGLRGVAVSVVVLYHIGLRQFSGGYVGVDVFFVISGYLITGQLLRDLELDGKVHLRSFWAGRLRRLMPLLSITVLGTLLVSFYVYSPLNWHGLADDAGASITYTSNLRFASIGQPYFSSSISPYLHMWSLGVEEQFYLGWPIALVVAGLLIRRNHWRVVRSITIVAAVGTALSFLYGWGMTRRRSLWAFYGSPARAWEFGLGALAFVGAPTIARLAPVLKTFLGWVAMLAMISAAVVFDEYTPFPGIAAVVPAGATALLIAIESGSRWSVSRSLLSLRPLRSLGNVSYAVYLLHWPAIVLVAAATDDTGVGPATVAALAALVVAVLATKWIERPIRQSTALLRPRKVYAVSAAAVLIIVALGSVTRWETTRRLHDPYLAELAAIRAGRSHAAPTKCVPRAVAVDLNVCMYGPSGDRPLVVLIGDSHAGEWSQAVLRATEDLGYRYVDRADSGCSAYDVYAGRTGFNVASKLCLAFRAQTDRVLTALQPDLTIISNRDYSSVLLRTPDGGRLGEAAAARAYASARTRFAQHIHDLGSRLAVIGDTPTQPVDPIECLAFHRSGDDCSSQRSKVVPKVAAAWATERETLTAVMPVGYLDTIPLICDETVCYSQRNGIVLYSDPSHLSVEFTLTEFRLVEQLIVDNLDS